MRVLFANHTGELAGAERSLLDLLDALGGRVSATIACPAGDLLDALRTRDHHVVEIPSTSLSFRLHPVHTPRGMSHLALAGLRLRRIAREVDADLIHANTERAGLAAALAGFGGPPIVVHARAPFPDGRAGRATAATLCRGARVILANSRFTARQFPCANRVRVVHNPIDPSRFDPALIDPSESRAEIGLAPDDLVLAVVGYLAPVKCQDDAIRILASLKATRPNARLVVAGATRFTGAAAREDALRYETRLRELAGELGVEDDVLFIGERADVRGVLAAADVVLVPSRSEGFGRVVLETLAMARPVVATNVGGTTEIVRDGVDGLLLAPGDPKRWAEEVDRLLGNAERRGEMGANGRRRAAVDFSPAAHTEGILSAYEKALGSQAHAAP